jgi:hypothetical protein
MGDYRQLRWSWIRALASAALVLVGCGGGDDGPPHHVAACDGLPAAGTWEQITPPGVSLPGPEGAAFGVNAVATDPNNAGTLILGTSEQGIWKSTDCGSTWVHVNTGTAGAACPDRSCNETLDTGRGWTLAIDPEDSNVVYINNGFGAGHSGLFKSENGGVDWRPIWPDPDATPGEFEGVPGFVGALTLDPHDHRHLVVDMHENCSAPHTPLCLVESLDGGETWSVADTDPAQGAFNAHDALHYILDDSDTWLYAANGEFWRTANAGDTWAKVADLQFHVGGYNAPDGTMYIGLQDGIARSTNGTEWAPIPDSGNLVGNIVSDGTHLYTSNFANCFAWGEDLQPYLVAPADGAEPWTSFPSPGLTQGGVLAIDVDHRVLYSSNCQDGLWRVVLPP